MILYNEILIILLLFWLISIVFEFGHFKSVPVYTVVARLVLVILTILVTLFVGMRGLTGTDTKTYKLFYETGYFHENVEPAYRILSSFFSAHQFSFTVFEIFIATLTFSSIMFAIMLLSKNYMFSIVILYLYCVPQLSLNISRQMLAVGIYTLGVALILDNKFIKGKSLNTVQSKIGVLLFLLAFFFHTSTLIAVFIFSMSYILYKIVFRRGTYFFVIGCCSLTITIILSKVNFVYNLLTSIATSGYLSKYTEFIMTDSAQTQLTEKSTNVFLIGITMSILFIVIGLFCSENRFDKMTEFLLFYSAFFLLIQASQVNWISDRLGYYFLPLLSITFSRVIYNEILKDKILWKIVLTFFIFVTSGLFYSHVVIGNFGNMYPYIGDWSLH